MNYSDSPGHVRADRFRKSGKWYDTFMLDMSAVWDFGCGPIEAVEEALRLRRIARDDGHPSLNGFDLVVLEPYHRNEYPVMLRGPE